MSRAGLLSKLCENGEFDGALPVLARLASPATTATYLRLLKACHKNKALGVAQIVREHILLHGVSLSGSLGEHLVLTLAKCGALDDAYFILKQLPHTSVLSWTALISAHVDRGHGYEAISTYGCMLESNVQPNDYSYVSLFKACGSIPDLLKGMGFHSDAHMKGFASSVFAGNTLVSMYGKCGAISEAKHVFRMMMERTIVSWNAMLSAFVEVGHAVEALELYAQMLHECVIADVGTYVAILQACSLLLEEEGSLNTVMCFEIGHALHAEIQRSGFASDLFVASALINLYGKCKAIILAEHVFYTLSAPSTVLWNVMMSAYVEYDQAEKALQLYARMRKEKLSPDDTTYVLALQACSSLAENEETFYTNDTKVMSLQIGQMLHTSSDLQGCTSNVLVSNSLLTMYGKCGALAEAEYVFCTLSDGTVMSWNAMLSVYIEMNQADLVLLLYMQMQVNKVMPDQRTFVIILQACTVLAENEEAVSTAEHSVKMASLEIGQALHANLRKQGLERSAFVGSALVSMYGACGFLNGVENIFSVIKNRDTVTWNALLSAYVEQGQGEKVLLLYKQMLLDGRRANPRTFVIVLQACVLIADREGSLLINGYPSKTVCLDIGRALHIDVDGMGFASDIFVGNSLISMFGKCEAIFEAETIFSALPQRDIVSWNAIVSAYIDGGRIEEALRLYRMMCSQCITPVTLTRILQACCETGSLDICRQLHFELVATGHNQNTSVASTLISAYGGCASMLDAEACFDELIGPDRASWNACITGHAGEGNQLLTFHLLENMILGGVEIDKVTFVSLYSACAHTGLVAQGLEIFEIMNRDFGICPDMKHYGSLLNLLGRAGDFRRVESVLERMPMQADITLWLCLLGACTCGNLELAKRAFEKAVSLQPEHASPYVLMSNIYADAWLQEYGGERDRQQAQRGV